MKKNLIKLLLREYTIAIVSQDNTRADMLFRHLMQLKKKWWEFWK